MCILINKLPPYAKKQVCTSMLTPCYIWVLSGKEEKRDNRECTKDENAGQTRIKRRALYIKRRTGEKAGKTERKNEGSNAFMSKATWGNVSTCGGLWPILLPRWEFEHQSEEWMGIYKKRWAKNSVNSRARRATTSHLLNLEAVN